MGFERGKGGRGGRHLREALLYPSVVCEDGGQLGRKMRLVPQHRGRFRAVLNWDRVHCE